MDVVAYLICMLIGVAQLLPWNAFINTYSYWMWKYSGDEDAYKTRNAPNNTEVWNDTFYQTFWTSSLGFAVEAAVIFMIFINMFYGHKFSRDSKIYVLLSIILATFVVTTIFTQIDTSAWYETFFVVTLIITMINQGAAGWFQTVSLGLGNILAEPYLNGIVQGQAWAGILTSVLAIIPNIIFKEDYPYNTDTIEVVNQYRVALMFFCIATFTILLTIVCYYVLINKEWVQEKIRMNESSDSVEMANDVSEQSEGLINETKGHSFSSYLKLVKKLFYPLVIGIMLNLAITIAIFPAVTQTGVSQCNDETIETSQSYCDILGNELFVLVFNFLWFNVSDLVGRVITGNTSFIGEKENVKLVILTLLRILSASLFFLTRNSNSNGLSFLGYDWGYALVMFIFAASNGWLLGTSIGNANKLMENHERDMGANLIMLGFGCGVLLGAVTSFGTVVMSGYITF